MSNINKAYTTELELMNFARANKLPLNGVYAKDTVPKRLYDSGYIVNMDTSDQQGSHWVAFYIKGKHAIYFDSFGQPPPLEIAHALKPYKLEINRRIIQNPSSGYCGAFCLVFIWFITLHTLKSFQKLWSPDILENKRILQYYIAINT